MSADDEFPSIVRKAQDDVQWRKALSRLGYSQVRAAYAQHRQEGLDVFQALGGQDRSAAAAGFRARLAERGTQAHC